MRDLGAPEDVDARDSQQRRVESQPQQQRNDDSTDPSTARYPQGVRVAMMLAARHLEFYFRRDFMSIDINYWPPPDASYCDMVRGWVLDRNSRFLPLEPPLPPLLPGRPGVPGRGQTSILAQYCIGYVGTFNDPMLVVSYFCKLRPGPENSGVAPELQGLVALVYALISQMIPLQNRFLITMAETCIRDLRGLQGEADTLGLAIDILDVLVSHIYHPVVFCVIDNLQCLMELTTAPGIARLLDILRRRPELRKPNPIRLLLTNSGRSSAVLEEVRPVANPLAEETPSAAAARDGMYFVLYGSRPAAEPSNFGLPGPSFY